MMHNSKATSILSIVRQLDIKGNIRFNLLTKTFEAIRETTLLKLISLYHVISLNCVLFVSSIMLIIYKY